MPGGLTLLCPKDRNLPISSETDHMALTITSEMRNALYDRILDRLSGIGDVWLAAESGNFETAERLAREFSDELLLVGEDLGWGSLPAARNIDLQTPPEVLARLFSRLRDSAASERAARASEWAESRNLEERNRLVSEACANVLRRLEGTAR